jgi:hypothetical protein
MERSSAMFVCLVLAACSGDAMTTVPMLVAGTGAPGVPAAAGSTGAAGSTTVGTAAGAGGVVGTAGGAGGLAAGSGGAAAAAGAAGTAMAGTGAAGSAAAAGSGAAGSDAGNSGAAGATAGAGGAAGMPTAGSAAPMHADLGKGDGSDVITIGDSWMSNTLGTGNAIEGALQRLTRQPYRNYGVQGVLLTAGGLFGAAIPTQYDSAKRQDPDIKTVIMTGGGNDIIQDATVQSSCMTGGDACIQTIMKIGMTLNTLWTKMSDDGVQDVVYIRYSDDAGTTVPNIREMGRTPPPICTMGKIRCHSIETTDVVMAELIDGIHPSQAANDRIVKVVVDYFEKNGIRR